MKILKRLAVVSLIGAMVLTILSGCDSGSGSGNSRKVELINTMLKADGYDITVTESDELAENAEAYAKILKDTVEVSEDLEDTDERIWKMQQNDYVGWNVEIYETTLASYNREAGLSVNYSDENGWPNTDEARAKDVADQIIGLLEDDGKTVASIGIVEADFNMREQGDETYTFTSSDGEEYEFDWLYTRKRSGWIWVVSYK